MTQQQSRALFVVGSALFMLLLVTFPAALMFFLS